MTPTERVEKWVRVEPQLRKLTVGINTLDGLASVQLWERGARFATGESPTILEAFEEVAKQLPVILPGQEELEDLVWRAERSDAPPDEKGIAVIARILKQHAKALALHDNAERAACVSIDVEALWRALTEES